MDLMEGRKFMIHLSIISYYHIRQFHPNKYHKLPCQTKNENEPQTTIFIRLITVKSNHLGLNLIQMLSKPWQVCTSVGVVPSVYHTDPSIGYSRKFDPTLVLVWGPL